MSNITFALVREQNVEFAAVIVRDHVMNSQRNSNQLISELEFEFRRPVVLLGEHNGRWFGRRDIVNFLSHVHPSRLPWRRGQIN